ncbi:MAG: hypothetical protein IPN34_26550 [Planctomycetes bacterium]|nr:hypothetical protein [Planctomycetota bacterium]
MDDDWLYRDTWLGFGLRRGSVEWHDVDPEQGHRALGEGLTLFGLEMPVSFRARVRRRAGATLDSWIAGLWREHHATHEHRAGPRERSSAEVERQRVRFRSKPHVLPPRVADFLVVRRGEWFYELCAAGELPREGEWREEMLRALDAAQASFVLDLQCTPRLRLPPRLPLDLEEHAWRDAERYVHLGLALELRTPVHWCAVASLSADPQRRVLRFVSAEPGLDSSLEFELDPLEPEDLAAWSAHLRASWGDPDRELSANLGEACVGAWRSFSERAEADLVDLLHAAFHVGRAAVSVRMELGAPDELRHAEAALARFAAALRSLDEPALEAARAEHAALCCDAAGWDPGEAEGEDWDLRSGRFRDELVGFELAAAELSGAWSWRVADLGENWRYILSGADLARGFRVTLRAVPLEHSLEAHHANRVDSQTIDAPPPRRAALSERRLLSSMLVSEARGIAPGALTRTWLETLAVSPEVVIELELEGPARRAQDLGVVREALLAGLRFDLEELPRVRETERGWELPRWGLAFELEDEAWVPERNADQPGALENTWFFARERESFGLTIQAQPFLAVGEREACDQKVCELVAWGDEMEMLEERALPEVVVLGLLVRGTSWRYRIPSEDGGEPAHGVQSLWTLWLGRKHVWLRHFQPGLWSFGDPAESAPLLGGLRGL